MNSLPAPPRVIQYLPHALAAVWVLAELVVVRLLTLGDDGAGDDAWEAFLTRLMLSAALPAALTLACLFVLCGATTARKKVDWVVTSVLLCGLAALLLLSKPAVAVFSIAFAGGTACWFFAYRAFGRGVLAERHQTETLQHRPLSTRKIMALTLTAAVFATLLRWLSKNSVSDANLATIGVVALASGIVTGGCWLSLALAILRARWSWYLAHAVSVVVLAAAVFAVAVLWVVRLQMEHVVLAALAWGMTLFHFAIFCSVLRTSGYRMRKI